MTRRNRPPRARRYPSRLWRLWRRAADNHVMERGAGVAGRKDGAVGGCGRNWKGCGTAPLPSLPLLSGSVEQTGHWSMSSLPSHRRVPASRPAAGLCCPVVRLREVTSRWRAGTPWPGRSSLRFFGRDQSPDLGNQDFRSPGICRVEAGLVAPGFAGVVRASYLSVAASQAKRTAASG